MAPVFTYSVDDGHPADLKMADLLAKHGLHATFYVPLKNCEGLPVLSAAEIRTVGQAFEIGSHTFDHRYLNTVCMAEAAHQIESGKHSLEAVLGHPVAGFCYPGGKFTYRHLALVRRAGFLYARTTVNLRFDRGNSPFEMPTTIQFYPHARGVYLRNFLQFGNWNSRKAALVLALSTAHWLDRIYLLFDHACQHDGAFHLWAHSHEIERLALWQELDDFLAHVASIVAPADRKDNRGFAAAARD